MSLRKTPRLTSRRIEAARQNAQRSTGPRSAAGKERMRMNALKHGCDAAPANDAAIMRALGEDPARLAGADIRFLMSARFAAANRFLASAITSKSFASRDRRSHKSEVCASRWKVRRTRRRHKAQTYKTMSAPPP